MISRIRTPEADFEVRAVFVACFTPHMQYLVQTVQLQPGFSVRLLGVELLFFFFAFVSRFCRAANWKMQRREFCRQFAGRFFLFFCVKMYAVFRCGFCVNRCCVEVMLPVRAMKSWGSTEREVFLYRAVAMKKRLVSISHALS